VTGWVIDSSLALAWALPDERSARADGFWSEITGDVGLFVPALWWYEVVNAMVVARRRERLDEAASAEALELLARLPLTVDPAEPRSVARSIEGVACSHQLSAYDAAYLELALRLGAGLASLDSRLCDASRAAGLTIW